MNTKSLLRSKLEDFFVKKQEGYSKKRLQNAFKEMHRRYTSGKHSEMALRSMEEVIAYISVRRLATIKSVEKAIYRLQEVFPTFTPKSILDVGSGPLTAFEAVAQAYQGSLDSAYFIESNPFFCALINEFLASLPSGHRYRLISKDMTIGKTYELLDLSGGRVDMAIFSYSLGEIAIDSIEKMIAECSSLCRLILIVEPGTPRSASHLLIARDAILKQEGWTIIAPCPHEKSCPLKGSAEWCHEFVRLDRSHLAKEIKEGSLGYEDEPMSYLIAAYQADPQELIQSYMRIVRAPQHRSGHTHCTVCKEDGQLQEITVSRRDSNRYKKIKKAEWGDLIETNME